VDCYTHNGSHTEALAAYDKIIFLDPKFAQAHNNRGVVLQNFGRYTDALDSFDRAIALESNFSDAHVNRGNALRHLQLYDDALVAYDKALALNSHLPQAWLGRGNVFSELKRYDEAGDYGCINPRIVEAGKQHVADQRRERWPQWLEETWGPEPEGPRLRAEALARDRAAATASTAKLDQPQQGE
jgi:lipoprotein NlpI